MKIKNKDPNKYSLQETHFRFKDTHRLKMKGCKKIFHATGNEKWGGKVIRTSDKIDFRSKAVRRGKEKDYIIKG